MERLTVSINRLIVPVVRQLPQTRRKWDAWQISDHITLLQNKKNTILSGHVALIPLFIVRLKRRSLCVTVYNNQNNLQTQNKVAGVSHLTRALTVERTTLESRNRGVTRMWNRDREAKATAGDRSASSEMWTWTTNVCGGRQRRRERPGVRWKTH